MRVWRIARRRFQALDGEGARLAGGRWNSEGVPVIYTSSTLSLAALEYLVHVEIEDVPDDLFAIEIDVPDDAPMEQVAPATLPENWRRVPDHPACVRLGDEWVRRREALVLRVPSAAIPEESNALLNPEHPAAALVRLIGSRDFSFDPRLLLTRDCNPHQSSGTSANTFFRSIRSSRPEPGGCRRASTIP